MRGVGFKTEHPRRDRPLPELHAIYEEQLAYVWNSLMSLGIREPELEDVTHEVFLKAFLTFDGYDRSRPLRPWLFGIAMRAAVDHRRLARHRHETGDATPELMDPQPGPEHRLGQAEERALLQEALDQLDWERRAMVVMFYLNGHTIDEIAQVFPAPRFTLYSRLRLAREDLRQAILRQGGRRQ